MLPAGALDPDLLSGGIQHPQPGGAADLADAGEREVELGRERFDLSPPLRGCGEQELVVVAAG